MDEDTRNLLQGIGQPDFGYRQFDVETDEGPASRWPLIGLIAGNPALGVALGTLRPAPSRRKAPVNRIPSRDGSGSGFLNAYETGAHDPAGSPTQDIRLVLNRLSKEVE